MTKQELRKRYKSKRAELSLEACEEKSLAIANRCLKLPIWEKSIYHLFLSIERQKEVNTEYLMHILQGRDKNIVVSKSDFSTLGMTHFLLTDSTVLKLNAWGIPEPVKGIEIRPKQVEVVFVPLLAFDQYGNRIGYGKGFYDRFLEQCHREVIKIGLSFFTAEKHIDADSHDTRLD